MSPASLLVLVSPAGDITVFFLLLLFPASFLLLCHVTIIRVPNCVKSVWVFAVVLRLTHSCFLALSEELLCLSLCFSIFLQKHILKASGFFSVSLGRCPCFTLRILQSSSLTPSLMCLPETVFVRHSNSASYIFLAVPITWNYTV